MLRKKMSKERGKKRKVMDVCTEILYCSKEEYTNYTKSALKHTHTHTQYKCILV